MRPALLLLSLSLLFCAYRQQPHYRIHILGDSTTEQQNQNLSNQRGWPQVLGYFFTDQVTVLNHGKFGTSTRTFYHGPYWEKARQAILPGDYVVVQFAHNDQRHQGFDGDAGTAAGSTYREYLQRYIDEIRELGAIPILATPIVRKMWDASGEINRRGKHDLGQYVHQNVDRQSDPNDTVTFNYPLHMREVARANDCLLIDITESTAELVARLGNDAATRRVYHLGDTTHIGAEGALQFSKLFADALKSRGILTPYIIDEPEMCIVPDRIDGGEIILGAEYRQEIDLLRLSQGSDPAVFRIRAGDGVLISDCEYGEYRSEWVLESPFDVVHYRQLYVKTSPGKEGEFASRVTVEVDDRTYTIPVAATVRAYEPGEKAAVTYTLNGHPKPRTQGPVLALEHTVSGLKRTGFDHLGAAGIGAHLRPPLLSRALWLDVPEGEWPPEEIDLVFTRFAQFGMQAASGTDFRLERIGLYAGGGVNYRIVLSRDEDFADYTVLGTGGGAPLTRFDFPVNWVLKAGETVYLRIYPWTSKEQEQCLCLSQVVFSGQIETDR
ncbi:MAG: rhamnogalacturonan acetylesterase [Rikenellaceae bacterium]|nr:rhamnogalacturonan acetylesterase [Rikenellaceae bacterium]